MKQNALYIIQYLKNIYGGRASYKGSSLYLIINNEIYRVNLNEGRQEGCYTFYCIGAQHTGIQLKDKNLLRGIFLVWCSKFNESFGIVATEEDWLKFAEDAYKYRKGECK